MTLIRWSFKKQDPCANAQHNLCQSQVHATSDRTSKADFYLSI